MAHERTVKQSDPSDLQLHKVIRSLDPCTQNKVLVSALEVEWIPSDLLSVGLGATEPRLGLNESSLTLPSGEPACGKTIEEVILSPRVLPELCMFCMGVRQACICSEAPVSIWNKNARIKAWGFLRLSLHFQNNSSFFAVKQLTVQCALQQHANRLSSSADRLLIASCFEI